MVMEALMAALPTLTTEAAGSSLWLTSALSLSEMLANSSTSPNESLVAATTSSAAVATASTTSAAEAVGKVPDKHEVNDNVSTVLSSYPGYIHYRDKYDLSYIARVNPFWLQFEPPKSSTFYLMAALYCLISVVGCVGNAFVIFMFANRKSLRTPANILVMNLAICDFLMLVKCPIAIYNNIKEGPALGDAACRIYGFVGGLSGTCAIGTLTAIALDRYNVVVHPLQPLRRCSRLRSYLIIFLIWSYSFLFAVMPALDIGLSVYVPEGFLTTCSFDYLNKETPARIFMALFFVAAYCVPLTTIVYSYFYILKVVFTASRIQSNKDKAKTEQKLAFIVAAIIGLWFLAWSPYAIVAMMGVFGQERHITPLGSMIPALFCKTAACVDPYLYAATHPRFRVEVRMLFFGRGVLRRVSTTRSSYMTRSRSSFNRRLRPTPDAEHRVESYLMNNNLMMVPEETEENEEIVVVAEFNNSSYSGMEQSKF
ncbi:opsin, ultraviolet-sensitive [Drosophila pseudoobscura]|uniref:Opsin, ultraviolet-sensitive n=1 Tax=Drosophila pseudoobscura pseudoobscura TaxID=46245 RepID=A0A6I8W806_DROPS|nr:opsin, ultraviolet-sensitive [Drosophila pseudoobscura]XP_015042772.2 opsin, ultraviolet-sensitive [Drosophila pseudoobscura]XP_033239503.1 opsin, ultraviolet-sensitive [Drosophila pseudoobscura]